MEKYINADSLTKRLEGIDKKYFNTLRTTIPQVVSIIKGIPPENVIPVDFIEEWYKKNYHTSMKPALITAWEEHNK